MQVERSIAPTKFSGKFHVTDAILLPGSDVAATERGGPGGDGIIEGVGVGDTLQDRERNASSMKSHAQRRQSAWARVARTTSISRSRRCKRDACMHRRAEYPHVQFNHCSTICTHLADFDDVVLLLADSDTSEGAALTDGDEDEEAAAVMVLDADDDSEGAAVDDTLR
jgi:hypothetical protein